MLYFILSYVTVCMLPSPLTLTLNTKETEDRRTGRDFSPTYQSYLVMSKLNMLLQSGVIPGRDSLAIRLYSTASLKY